MRRAMTPRLRGKTGGAKKPDARHASSRGYQRSGAVLMPAHTRRSRGVHARFGADRRPWPDPRDLRLHRPPDKRDVPYVPTESPVVQAMLDFAGVGPGDVLFDLGCGDGRIPIAAAKR